MEKGIARLVEAATVAAEEMLNHDITLEITVKGVRAKITWTEGERWTENGRRYTQENLTPWSHLHPRPDTPNPLLAALDNLVQARTEFKP